MVGVPLHHASVSILLWSYVSFSVVTVRFGGLWVWSPTDCAGGDLRFRKFCLHPVPKAVCKKSEITETEGRDLEPPLVLRILQMCASVCTNGTALPKVEVGLPREVGVVRRSPERH